MTIKRHEYTVTGRYPFPTDMLRYDGAHPANPQSVDQMQAGIVGPSTGKPFRDRPILHIRLASIRPPTEQRWNSFGWYIEAGSHEEVKL
jgi:hypothetical protein